MPNNFFASCVIYAYVSVKICITIGNNKKIPKNNKITLYIRTNLTLPFLNLLAEWDETFLP